MPVKAKHIAYAVGFLILLQGAYLIYIKNWSNLFVVALAFSLTTLPFFLARRYDYKVSWKIQAGIAVFLFSTLVLGEIHRFYDEIKWWDLAVHFLAGLGITFIGYRILFRMVYEKVISATPLAHTLFTSFGTLAILAIWEIYEFGIDTLGWAEGKMQPSNTDTMLDLVVGLIGVLLVSIPGYYFLSQQSREMRSREI